MNEIPDAAVTPSKLKIPDRPESAPRDLLDAITELVTAAKFLTKECPNNEDGYETDNLSLRSLARLLFRESGPAAVDSIAAWTQRTGQAVVTHKGGKVYVNFAEKPLKLQQLQACIKLGVGGMHIPSPPGTPDSYTAGVSGLLGSLPKMPDGWTNEVIRELRDMRPEDARAVLGQLPYAVVIDAFMNLLRETPRG